MDTEQARALLARERHRVERALAGLGPEDAAGDDDVTEPEDVAEGNVETELDEAVAESLNEELAAIERAEQRLAEGTYGVSVVSGEPIPDARLEAVPWAERTIEEQAQYEHSG